MCFGVLRGGGQGAAQLEALQAITTLCVLADRIQDRVNQFRALGVKPFRPVVACVGLPCRPVVACAGLSKNEVIYELLG